MIKRNSAQMAILERHPRATDRRASRRFRLKWSAKISRIDETGRPFCNNGELNNLSSGGSHLILDQSLEVGDRIAICIKLPLGEENWMKYSGEVIRLRKKDPKIMVGIKFDKSRPEFIQANLTWN